MCPSTLPPTLAPSHPGSSMPPSSTPEADALPSSEPGAGMLPLPTPAEGQEERTAETLPLKPGAPVPPELHKCVRRDAELLKRLGWKKFVL